MPVIDYSKFSVNDNEDIGILGFLFPGIPVMFKARGDFISKECIVVGGVGEIIGEVVVYKFSYKRGIKINSRDGIVKFLEEVRGFKEIEKLKDFDDEEFWRIVKFLCFNKKFALSDLEERGNLYPFYKEVFESFREAYVLYRSLGIPYGVVFSSLMTVMIKAQSVENESLYNIRYKTLLFNLKRFLIIYKKAVIKYLETNQSEMDFLNFMFELSSGR